MRDTALDGGLHEFAHAAWDADLLIGDAVERSRSPSPPDPASLPRRGRALARPTEGGSDEKVTVKLVATAGTVDAMISTLTDLGGDIVSRGPQVLLANVPHARLEALAGLPGLRRAEHPQRLRPQLDEARGPVTRADLALAHRPDISGEGVVVGIVDSGTDWRHPDFRDADGRTRIEMLLHAEHDDETGIDTFREFAAGDIDAALHRDDGSVPDGDLDGHGTHCASIAAGNGHALPDRAFRGLATDATLMAVRSDTLHDTHIIEGIRRIFSKAGDRPCVVNLSLGGHIGPHDGTSALENVISRETGPGRIVVVAAGNEASDRIHFAGRLIEGQTLDIEFTIRDSLQIIDVWIPRGDEADITVMDSDGVETEPTGDLQQTAAGAFRADLRIDQLNRDVNLGFAVIANALDRPWRLRLHATKVRQGQVHAWGQTQDFSKSRDIFMSEISPRYSIGMPATEERAIAVASLVSRTAPVPAGAPVPGLRVGGLSGFSSHGPTRLGGLRPDIAAPGQHIVAALAAGGRMATDPDLAERRLHDDRYISIQGTSMATPFVAGTVALMLQQEPHLSPEDIQLRLRATAQRDDDTGAVWNPGFGYGKIDVEALLNYTVVA